jgi:hypothetical protein
VSLEDTVMLGYEAPGSVVTELADMQQALNDEELHVGWTMRQRGR